jgi:tRNA splicing ligase
MFNTQTHIYFKPKYDNDPESDLVEVEETKLRWNDKVLWTWETKTGKWALCCGEHLTICLPTRNPDMITVYSNVDLKAREYVVMNDNAV